VNVAARQTLKLLIKVAIKGPLDTIIYPRNSWLVKSKLSIRPGGIRRSKGEISQIPVTPDKTMLAVPIFQNPDLKSANELVAVSRVLLNNESASVTSPRFRRIGIAALPSTAAILVSSHTHMDMDMGV
jgi:hypothetical protein